MMIKHVAAALVLAAVPVFAGASAAPHESAAARAPLHVARLLLHETASRSVDQRNFVGTDRVRSRTTGRVVGFDSFSGHIGRRDRVGFQVAFAFKGGLLLVRLHTVGKAPARFAGRVTGGTGTFDGARGTASGVAVAQDETRVTLRYRL